MKTHLKQNKNTNIKVTDGSPIVAPMYLRISRPDEHNEPLEDVLARHRKILTEYAAQHNIIIAKVYAEVVSGDKLADRPRMRELLSELSNYDAVLCVDIDRLGRGDMADQGVIFGALRDANVKIITPDRTYDPADDIDDSLISFKALFAREEYKLIKGRLIGGKLDVIAAGGYVANAPFGYRKTRNEKKIPTLEIIPEEAVAVRKIFALYLEGKGCEVISEIINALGYKPRRSERFGRTSIGKILRNPVYIGKIVWNRRTYKRPTLKGEKHKRTENPSDDWMIYNGAHEPIIDEETFYRVNAMLDMRYHPPYRNSDEVKNPLAGILTCARCGRNMTRIPLYNHNYQSPIIGCPTKGCQMSTRQNIVEQLVYTMLVSVLDNLNTEYSIEDDAQVAINEEVTKAAKLELSKLKNQLLSLHDYLERGVYDVETFVNRRESLQSRIKDTETQIKELSKTTKKSVVAEKLTTVLDNYWEGTPTERNNLIKQVVGRIDYSKPKGSGFGSFPSLTLIEWSDLV